MDNHLKFILELKDMMSGMLPKVANTARSVFGNVDRTVGRTQKGLNDLGKSVSLKVDTSSIDRASREVDSLNRKMGGMGGGGGSSRGGFGGFFGAGLAVQGVMAAGRATEDIIKSTLDKGMDAEQQIIGLATFVGKQKALGIYKDLQKQAVLTPFTTADMLPVEMGLVATGMKPERANKDMMNLMSAVSATGNQGNSFMFQLMGSHLAQAASAGNIDGLLLREFQRTAHIPVTRLIANDMFPNLSPQAGMRKVKDMDSITYDQFSHALERAANAGGMFAGALEAQSQTIRGKWSTIKDYLGIGQASAILNPKMHDNILKLEDGLIDMVKGIPAWVESMQPLFSRIFSEAGDLWPNIKAFANSMLDLLKPIGAILISDGFKDALKGIIDFGKEIADDLLPVMKALGASIQWIVNLLPGGKELKPLFEPQAFVFADTAGIGAAGKEVNESRMKAMSDSLKHIGGGKVFPNYKAFDAFNRDQKSLSKQFSSYTKVAVPLATKRKDVAAKGGDALQSGADSAVRGGSKQIIINAHFGEHMVNHFSNVKEGVKTIMDEFKEQYLRLIVGIPGLE